MGNRVKTYLTTSSVYFGCLSTKTSSWISAGSATEPRKCLPLLTSQRPTEAYVKTLQAGTAHYQVTTRIIQSSNTSTFSDPTCWHMFSPATTHSRQSHLAPATTSSGLPILPNSPRSCFASRPPDRRIPVLALEAQIDSRLHLLLDGEPLLRVEPSKRHAPHGGPKQRTGSVPHIALTHFPRSSPPRCLPRC